MRLFLDASSRVFRGQAPDGAGSIPDFLSSGAIELQVSDADWQQTYYPAWLSAHQAGQDLVVAVDGSTSTAAHTASPLEAAIATLRAFALNASPAEADQNAAIKALIVAVRRLAIQLS
jgi:hypothetical protein